MEQFNLEKYLENPSRKVVTRDGREVEILKTDFRGYKQIIGVVKNRDNKDDEVDQWDGQGNFRSLFGESKYDLFFADEEEELTEIQKTLEEDCDCYVNLYNDGKTREELREWIKSWCPRIINLAIKEFEKSNPYSENQKQWSEEDERHRKRIIERLEDIRKSKEDNIDVVSVILSEINWLKSIKPQPKYQWTDEDEKNLKDLLAYGETKLGLRRWIAGLPEKLGSRSEYHWKPSEEQMEALFEAKLASIKNREYFLGLLYEDLKKL